MPVIPGLLSRKNAFKVKTSSLFIDEPSLQTACPQMIATTLLPAKNPQIEAGQGLRSFE